MGDVIFCDEAMFICFAVGIIVLTISSFIRQFCLLHNYKCPEIKCHGNTSLYGVITKLSFEKMFKHTKIAT